MKGNEMPQHTYLTTGLSDDAIDAIVLKARTVGLSSADLTDATPRDIAVIRVLLMVQQELTPRDAYSPACAACGKRIVDKAVWMKPDGEVAGPPLGDPYHTEHAPRERVRLPRYPQQRDRRR